MRCRRYEAHRWHLSGGVEENYRINDPPRFEPSTSFMHVTTVTDYDKFLNRLVIVRKAVLLRNQLSVTFSAILKLTALQLGV